MIRNIALKTISRLKAAGTIEGFIRYNSHLRKCVVGQSIRFDEQFLIERIMRAAQATGHGRSFPQELSAWPILEKETLRQAPQDFINPHIRLRIPAATGGTTGVPLKLWRSLESIAAEQFFLDRLLEPYAQSMRSKMAVLRADSVKAPADSNPPFGRFSHGGRRLTLSSVHLNAQTIHWFHDALSQFAPDVLWIYPSVGINLLTLLQQASLPLHIPVILASSELLSSAAHAELAQYFNAQVINYYGQAERVCLAHGTQPGHFYFDRAYGKVELAFTGDETDAGKTAHIIATNFWNMAMPLIRYRTGDFITVPAEYGDEELQEVAAGSRAFTGISGRDGEYLLTRDGMRIIGLNHIPKEIPGLLQMQIVQLNHEEVRIDMIVITDFDERYKTVVLEQARAKLPASMRVEVHTVRQLRQTANGKTPYVIRLL